MKTTIKIIAIIMAAILLLAGCGKSSYSTKTAISDSYAGEVAESEYSGAGNGFFMAYDEEAGSTDNKSVLTADSSYNAATQPANRKLIKTAQVEMESKQYEKSLAQLITLVEEKGGYIENQSEYGTSLQSSYYNTRHAYLDIRIPVSVYDETMTQMGSIGNITYKSTSIDDVTDHYTDVEARLNTLKIEEERLLDMLKKATVMSDLIELESRLSNVRYEIESWEGTLRNLDDKISYSTIHCTLTEVTDYSAVYSTPQTFGERLGDAFRDSIHIVKNGAQNFLVWFVTWLPTLIIWAAIIFVVIILIRKIKKNGKGQHFSKLRKKEAPGNDKSE